MRKLWRERWGSNGIRKQEQFQRSCFRFTRSNFTQKCLNCWWTASVCDILCCGIHPSSHRSIPPQSASAPQSAAIVCKKHDSLCQYHQTPIIFRFTRSNFTQKCLNCWWTASVCKNRYCRKFCCARRAALMPVSMILGGLLSTVIHWRIIRDRQIFGVHIQRHR